jgi:hypothetical protein
MEDIEAEIQEKVIEKVVETEELKPVKQKKPRTEAQKAAFEKARAKRMENLKKKQEEEVTAQVEDKPAPAVTAAPKRRGRPRGNKVKEQIPVRPEPVNHPVYQPVNHGIPFNQNIPQNYYQWSPQPIPQQPQPVNNYYYYGAPPPTPQHSELARPLQPIELVEDSSSEEEYEYIQETYNAPRPQPKLQFRFA